MTQRDTILQTIKYLEYRAIEVDNPHEWREVCGLIMQLIRDFEITEEEHNKLVQEVRDILYPTKVVPLDEMIHEVSQKLIKVDCL